MPYFYVQDYARDQGVSTNLASYALTILNAASIFGRIIPNWLADTYGSVYAFSPPFPSPPASPPPLSFTTFPFPSLPFFLDSLPPPY